MKQTINLIHLATSALYTEAALQPERWAPVTLSGEVCDRCGLLLTPEEIVRDPEASFDAKFLEPFCVPCRKLMAQCWYCGAEGSLRRYGRKLHGEMVAICGQCDDRGE